MPYWMTHPEHGEMPVYDRGEVERVEKFGWKLLNEGPYPMREKEKKALAEAVANLAADIERDLCATVKRKPGRPPKAKQ